MIFVMSIFFLSTNWKCLFVNFFFWKNIVVLSKYKIRLHIGPLHVFENRAFEAEDAVYILLESI